MIDHVSIQCSDLEASAAFYDTVLATLGGAASWTSARRLGYGTDFPTFWLGRQQTGDGFRGTHLAFRAPDRDAVQAFRDAAVAAGAEVLHQPRGVAGASPGLLRCVVRYPDGNNVEAVHHTFEQPS